MKGGSGDAAETMKLNIETFSNIKGGNSFYKAVTHPLAARAVPRLLARIGETLWTAGARNSAFCHGLYWIDEALSFNLCSHGSG